ncbi:hypothetical protein HJFPF1_09448 [Paramyrothecium foliicola]|nr:hypothetical protein HJFPF1_09448 [Paramyrothecium foliicola]
MHEISTSSTISINNKHHRYPPDRRTFDAYPLSQPRGARLSYLADFGSAGQSTLAKTVHGIPPSPQTEISFKAPFSNNHEHYHPHSDSLQRVSLFRRADRFHRPALTGLTKFQTKMLQTAIDSAVKSGDDFIDADGLTDYLRRTRGVSEYLLDDQHFRIRANMLARSFKSALAAAGQSWANNIIGSELSTSSPEASEREKPLLQEPAPIHALDGSVLKISAGDMVVVLDTQQQSQVPPPLVSLSSDGGNNWRGFSYVRCQNNNSFITTETATRLGLDSTPGTQHKLVSRIPKGGPDRRTHESLFTVVGLEAVNEDVALGTELHIQIKVGHGTSYRDHVSDTAPRQKYTESSDVDAESSLFKQSQTVAKHDRDQSRDEEISELIRTCRNLAASLKTLTEMRTRRGRSKWRKVRAQLYRTCLSLALLGRRPVS